MTISPEYAPTMTLRCKGVGLLSDDQTQRSNFRNGTSNSGIVNLTDLTVYLGHAGSSNSLILCFGAGSHRPKYEKFCVKLTVPVVAFSQDENAPCLTVR